MTSQTGNDVTSRFVDHGFLSVFNTCFASVVYRSQVFVGDVAQQVGQLVRVVEFGHYATKFI
jgi:hypothetical protein